VSAKHFLVLVPLIALSAGCDQGLPTVPVSGSITFAGGPPPAAGTITFAPVEAAAGMPRRPGTGKFKPTDSSYEITSFQPGDGLVPGRYEVNVNCYTGTPSSARPETYVTLNAVPAEWKPDELVIEEGSDALEVNYDVPSKKK
jgi:hypothetical protein